MVRGSWKFLFIFLLPVIFDGTVMSSSWDQILDRQKIISHIIQETLKDLKLASLHHHNIPDDESIRQPFCMNNDYHNLSVCCSSKDLSNLFNVKIEKGKFIGYSSRPSQPIRLPPIMSLQYNSQPRYSNSFTVHNGTFSPQQCVKYFNGTLHVMAEETVHKLYHASM